MKQYTCFSTRMDVASVGRRTNYSQLPQGSQGNPSRAMRRSCLVPLLTTDRHLQGGRGVAAQLTRVGSFFSPVTPTSSLPARTLSRLPRNGVNRPPVSVLILLNGTAAPCAKWPLLFSFSSGPPWATRWVVVSPWQRSICARRGHAVAHVYGSPLAGKCHFTPCLLEKHTETLPQLWDITALC